MRVNIPPGKSLKMHQLNPGEACNLAFFDPGKPWKTVLKYTYELCNLATRKCRSRWFGRVGHKDNGAWVRHSLMMEMEIEFCTGLVRCS